LELARDPQPSLGADPSARHLPLPHVVSEGEYAAAVRRFASRILGEVRHGGEPPPRAPWPVVSSGLPVLGNGSALIELWLGCEPVVTSQCGPFRIACDRAFFFAAAKLALSPQDAIAAPTRRLYEALTQALAASACPHLLRVWNVIPELNMREDLTPPSAPDHERYRQFCLGRHEGLLPRLECERLPAASAIGSRGEGFALWLLAAREPGRQVENPRQLSAYRYPERYGPRSPSFARATLLAGAEDDLLFVAGTASIVGHESRHCGDDADSARRQAEEALRNIDALLEQAIGAGMRRAHRGGWLKVYLRDARHYPVVRETLARWAPGIPVLCLRADICRSDLNVEIEALLRSRAPPSLNR